MESIFSSGSRKDKINVFTPLLDDSEDFSLNLLSPNVFGVNGSKPSLSPHHEEVAPSSAKQYKKQNMFNGPLDESLLASPNPGVHYELLYESEVTPIKRDLFGCPSSDKSDSDSESSESQGSPSSPTEQLFNLKQVAANSNIVCPSCKMAFHRAYSKNLGKPAFAREVHRHFNACLAHEASSGTKPTPSDKQLETDISRNVARVRKAIGKFELQDRIKIMESLYRLGKTAASKTYGPNVTSGMLYSETAPSVNDNVDTADQQVLSLLYSNLSESKTKFNPALNSKTSAPTSETSTPRGPVPASISIPTNVSGTRKRRAQSRPTNESKAKHQRHVSIGATPTENMMMKIFGSSRSSKRTQRTPSW